MTRLARGIGLVALGLAGCATESGGVSARAGQTSAQLAEDRSQCLPFVQAHTETSPELAEAACLIPRGYRAPLPLAQGAAGIGSLYAIADRDANVMVVEFQACRGEALNTSMPENQDAKSSGIFSSFFGMVFPRGFWSKAMTPDEWAIKSFAACLSRRGYTVSDVAPVR
ncbi:MAG: hypothetical protein WEG40_07345 [Candidatus Rokuibacteriota bacterium]